MDKLCYIFLYFVFYSIIGYVCEVFYVYLGDKKWVNGVFYMDLIFLYMEMEQ